MLNITERVNEGFILVVAYHLFGFTDMITSLEDQYQLGWSLIGTILLNVLFNVVVFGIVIVQKCKLCCKRSKAHTAFKNQKKEAESRREALKQLKEEQRMLAQKEDGSELLRSDPSLL